MSVLTPRFPIGPHGSCKHGYSQKQLEDWLCTACIQTLVTKLGNALEDCHQEMVAEGIRIGADDYHEAINTARAALRLAGRLP